MRTEEEQAKSAERAKMIVAVSATAEVMGGKRLSDAALGVLAERASREPETGRAALRWLSENDSGSMTLAKLVKSIADIGPQLKNAKGAGGGCCGNGCPLPGSINTGGGWHCRFHLRAVNGPEADAITRALRENMEAIQTISELDRGFTRQGFETMCKLETLVIDEVNHNLAAIRAKSGGAFESALKMEKDTVSRADQLLAQVGRSRMMQGATA